MAKPNNFEFFYLIILILLRYNTCKGVNKDSKCTLWKESLYWCQCAVLG